MSLGKKNWQFSAYIKNLDWLFVACFKVQDDAELKNINNSILLHVENVSISKNITCIWIKNLIICTCAVKRNFWFIKHFLSDFWIEIHLLCELWCTLLLWIWFTYTLLQNWFTNYTMDLFICTELVQVTGMFYMFYISISC